MGKIARIIAGANYGDEGKGRVVAAYSQKGERVLNVLTNGGAQRGHSVIIDGNPVTFHHFGSGTYYGAHSYYSRYFILNPMAFVKEYDELLVKPSVIYRDPNCRWTTPFDMMANLIEEQQHGRHASCGMGIWKTVKRCHDLGNTSFNSFLSKDDQAKTSYLMSIKAYHERMTDIPGDWRNIWNAPNIIQHFINDCKTMGELTTVGQLGDLPYTELIFENGQGLLLCDHGTDTYDTTPSNTGINYATQLLSEMDDIDQVSLHYITRPYLTRHGDGALLEETDRRRLSCEVNEDLTNQYNAFQGAFRYGHLDIEQLKERIMKDSQGHDFTLEVTHCDEMDRISAFRKAFNRVNAYSKEW